MFGRYFVTTTSCEILVAEWLNSQTSKTLYEYKG